MNEVLEPACRYWRLHRKKRPFRPPFPGKEEKEKALGPKPPHPKGSTRRKKVVTGKSYSSQAYLTAHDPLYACKDKENNKENPSVGQTVTLPNARQGLGKGGFPSLGQF